MTYDGSEQDIDPFHKIAVHPASISTAVQSSSAAVACHSQPRRCDGCAAVPWSGAAEAAEASRCTRYSLGDVEHVVHESGVAWELLVEVSMRRVRAPASLIHYH